MRLGQTPSRLLTVAAIVLPATQAIRADDGNELSRRLDALEARLELLEEPDDTPWLTGQRAREVRALVTDVLAEADVRAAVFRDDESWAGWKDDFYLESADGRFGLEVSGQIQTRYTWNRRSRNGPDKTTAGFEVRRAKIKVKGNAFGKKLGYTIGLAHRVAGEELVLQSYNIRYRVSPQILVSLGRARPPLLREEDVSSKRQLAADRSLVEGAFDQIRALGVMLRYRTEPFRIAFGFGDTTAPGDFSSNAFRVSTRLDYRIGGDWDQFEDFTSFPGEPLLIAFGGGVLFESDDAADPVENDTTLFRWSADVSVELGGANFFVGVVGSRFDEETAPLLDQWGIVVQGGFFFLDDWELFTRYEYGDADGVDVDLSVITFGVNWYISQHDLKWTTDLGYGLKEVGDFWESDGTGWQRDRTGQDGQVVLRTQLQLLF